MEAMDAWLEEVAQRSSGDDGGGRP
jgi:hypothetical protein